jgi:hypothetical protein
MRTPFLAASAAVIVATSALAGCGDSVDKNAYVKSVGNVQKKTADEAATLSSEMSKATTPKQIGGDLEELGQAVEANATALSKIDAPKDVTSEHKQYVDLMKKFGTDLEDLADKVKAAKISKVSSMLTEASSLTTKLSSDEQRIVGAINAKLQS